MADHKIWREAIYRLGQKMFGEKAYMLIKELDRNRDSLPSYNTDSLNEINNEVKQLIAQNREDAQLEESGVDENTSYITTVKIRHAAVKRNLRCILAYHYNRIKCLRNMRWQFGSILPQDVKSNLSPSEVQWFSKYSTMLVQYMRSIGDDGGINLIVDLKPPKSLYIEVRCLSDYGQFELNDGSVLLLKQNSRHYLPRSECEELIRQGVLEHVVS